MKMTSERLLELMKLKVGDRIKVYWTPNYTEIFNIVYDEYNRILLETEKENGEDILLESVIDFEYEIMQKPNKIGNLQCKEIDCDKCPLKMFCAILDIHSFERSLFEAFKIITTVPQRYFDEEICDIVRKRLNESYEEIKE